MYVWMALPELGKPCEEVENQLVNVRQAQVRSGLVARQSKMVEELKIPGICSNQQWRLIDSPWPSALTTVQTFDTSIGKKQH